MVRGVFIRNWKIKALTGIHPHEQNRKQLLRLNVSLFQDDQPASGLEDVICYSTHKQRFEKIITAQHYLLLEMMAEALAKAAFEDAKVKRAVIEIEKMGIFKDVESCGVRLERERKT